MKKTTLFFAMFALLPLLILGCDPPNKNVQKNGDGAACCDEDHTAEGTSDHADQDAAAKEPAADPVVSNEPVEPADQPNPPVITGPDTATAIEEPAEPAGHETVAEEAEEAEESADNGQAENDIVWD